jgi:hypothetical protein
MNDFRSNVRRTGPRVAVQIGSETTGRRASPTTGVGRLFRQSEHPKDSHQGELPGVEACSGGIHPVNYRFADDPRVLDRPTLTESIGARYPT